MELRHANRYRSTSTTFYRWASPEGQPQNGEGLTLDISTRGVFVLATTCPPPGTQVEIEVWLPKLKDTSPEIRIQGKGQVLRVEHDVTRAGFAAAVRFQVEGSAEAELSGQKRVEIATC